MPVAATRPPYVLGILSSLLLLLLQILLSAPPVEPACARRPVIFNFGASNSDTGGLAAGLGYIFPQQEGRAFFHHSSGRLCDGRLVIDFLCESLNTSYLRPYMEPLGSDFSNGANFAVAGSKTRPSDMPFALAVQVRQFHRFKMRSLELIAQGESLNTSYLSPYMEPLGSDFSNGANFAIAGSKTRPSNMPFALAIQVMQFRRFKMRSLELIAQGESLNTSYLSPYMEPLGSDFSNGANFAIAGSKTRPSNMPFALAIQVMQFRRFKMRSLELIAQDIYSIRFASFDWFDQSDQTNPEISDMSKVTALKPQKQEFAGRISVLCKDTDSDVLALVTVTALLIIIYIIPCESFTTYILRAHLKPSHHSSARINVSELTQEKPQLLLEPSQLLLILEQRCRCYTLLLLLEIECLPHFICSLCRPQS
ncbi:hypothetical protein Cni_G11962 [Canna indica]|uniref:GDSL esterase/lipase n=1 Tax=Canna indica TaxID=4628 RepID=A0AAQ3KB30_9LILI|nr:hypothetical protein Cni_G11962 [Canna indica]